MPGGTKQKAGRMTRTQADLVIIGAGQAALTLAESLRRAGDMRSIIMLGEEPFPPYQRPPLSKAYLSGTMARERLWLKPDDWYVANDIALHTNARVVQIAREDAYVMLEGGDRVDYADLVIATGSRPRPFPSERGGSLPGVHIIRGMADIDLLAPALDTIKRVVVIGGGYIGLESAAILRKLGADVALVEAGPRILGRVACEMTADMIRALHLSQGVELHEGVGVTELRPGPDGHVASVQLDTGTSLGADLVIVGIGGLANADLAQACGLACATTASGGISVDALCRSSDPRIFAIGDVASFELGGQTLRLESVQNACDQARALAQTLAGTDTPYAPVPWFWSDQYDMKLQIAGLNIGADQTIFRPGKRAGTGSVWYFLKGRFIAIDALSDPRAYMTGKRLLERGADISAADVADPEHDIAALASA